MAFSLLPQALSLALAMSVMSNSTAGTLTCFGSHRQARSHWQARSHCVCVALVSHGQRLFATLWHLVFSLGSPHCVKVAFSECSHIRHPPVSPWHPPVSPCETQAWASAPCPHPLLWQWLVSCFSAERCYSAITSVVNSLWFALWTPSHTTALYSEFPKLPIPMMGFSNVQKLSFTTPFLREQVPVLKSFVSFHIFTFCPTSFEGDWLAFSEICLLSLRSCCLGILPYSDKLSMYLWGGR